MSLNDIQRQLLREIADLETVPKGAYNIRKNSESAGRNSTANIQIVSKEDKPGIDIIVKAARNESYPARTMFHVTLERRGTT